MVTGSPPRTAQVAVPAPLYQCFDYDLAEGQQVVPGVRVRVPFGPRRLVGVVTGLHTSPDARPRKAIETVAETYEQPRDLVRLYYNDQRLLRAMEVRVLEDQVVDWVLDHGKVTSVPMKMREVISAAAAAGQAK